MDKLKLCLKSVACVIINLMSINIAKVKLGHLMTFLVKRAMSLRVTRTYGSLCCNTRSAIDFSCARNCIFLPLPWSCFHCLQKVFPSLLCIDLLQLHFLLLPFSNTSLIHTYFLRYRSDASTFGFMHNREFEFYTVSLPWRLRHGDAGQHSCILITCHLLNINMHTWQH